jgi:ribosomal protein L24
MGQGIIGPRVEDLQTRVKIPNINGIKPGVRLWTVVSLLVLVALTIIFDAGDFVFIKKSLERGRQGSVKDGLTYEKGTSVEEVGIISVSNEEKEDRSTNSIALAHDSNRTNASNLNEATAAFLPILPPMPNNASNATSTMIQIAASSTLSHDQSYEAAAIANIAEGKERQGTAHQILTRTLRRRPLLRYRLRQDHSQLLTTMP